ncbi:MAG: zinc-dependent peptidase [Akkermansiaceae bacterium]|nr:zinc-dependent peptidase [Akkermansiaceae bacterium]
MTGIWILAGMVLVVLLAGMIHKHLRGKRRAEVRARDLTPEEWRTLRRRVPILGELPAQYRERLGGLVQVLLDEWSFEACGGLPEVTDEMRLVVAGQAALLLLESGYEDFGRLRSILLYPDAFGVRDDYGMEDVRLGESWETGSVVLSWQSILEGAQVPDDGLNVVLHEFAHQLDQADGVADGVPALRASSDYENWSTAFQRSYDELCGQVERGEDPFLDPYGATDPAEFFAVATETFFEKPRDLRRHDPAVYREMRQFYGLDPAEWGA